MSLRKYKEPVRIMIEDRADEGFAAVLKVKKSPGQTDIERTGRTPQEALGRLIIDLDPGEFGIDLTASRFASLKLMRKTMDLMTPRRGLS